MRNFIIKIIFICILAFVGGFLDAFLKDKNINITHLIFLTIGYIDCLICNWRFF